MPWKESSPMHRKTRFVVDYLPVRPTLPISGREEASESLLRSAPLQRSVEHRIEHDPAGRLNP
jgi:hypothetical protein